jgi:hypothetical protein
MKLEGAAITRGDGVLTLVTVAVIVVETTPVAVTATGVTETVLRIVESTVMVL